MIVKIPFLLSIIWAGFRWCESRDSLKFMALSGGFMDAAPTRPFINTLMFCIFKVFRWYTSGPSFTYVWFLVLEFLDLKCFHTTRKYNFRLLLSVFLNVTHWNVLKFVCLEFWPVMQCIVIHQAFDGFHFILKKHLKLSKKIDFLAHFERFLVYAFLRPMSYTPIFCQIKRLMEVHNCGKFH